MGYFDKFNHDGIPFMDGAEKASFEDILGKPYHIADFGFINGKDGVFGVIQLKETPGKFYFCNKIVTEMLQTVQADGMKDELPNQAIQFSKQVSKSGRDYFAFDFVA